MSAHAQAASNEQGPMVATMEGTGVLYRLLDDGRWHVMDYVPGAPPLSAAEVELLVPCRTQVPASSSDDCEPARCRNCGWQGRSSGLVEYLGGEVLACPRCDLDDIEITESAEIERLRAVFAAAQRLREAPGEAVLDCVAALERALQVAARTA